MSILLSSALHELALLGGMPASLAIYLETESILEVGNLQSSLLEAYKRDFGKYSPRSDHCLCQAPLGERGNKKNKLHFLDISLLQQALVTPHLNQAEIRYNSAFKRKVCDSPFHHSQPWNTL